MVLLKLNLSINKTCFILGMTAFSGVGSLNTNLNQASPVARRVTANSNGLYGVNRNSRGFNNFNYRGGFGGQSALGIGTGFNNTGFLIAALLIPALTSFVSALFSGGRNASSEGQGHQCDSCDAHDNGYDSQDAESSFENGFNTGIHGRL